MKLLTKLMPANFNLFLFGDKHEANSMSHEDGWEQLVDMLHSNYGNLPASANYACEHGDFIESIAVDDPRYDPTVCTEPIPFEQTKIAISQRKAIRKKYVFGLLGNHEWKLWRFGDLAKYICNELEIPYGTWSTRVTYLYKRDQSLIFKHFAAHKCLSLIHI